MKTLVVGGTGFAGGHAALYLRDQGYDVTVMSRSRPKGTSALNDLPFVQGDYVNDDFSDGRLEGYERLVFCAGVDVKYFPWDGSITPEEFYHSLNSVAIPRFFESVRAAGIPRTVYLGSFYPQVAPERIAEDPYVRSRHEADEAIRAMSSPAFNVCSCNAPYILGYTPGFAVDHLTTMATYASGRLEGAPIFAPPGGTNHMTCQSVSEALLGALERGESGKGYLIGDANLTWKEYFELWFAAAGNPQDLEVREDEHPIIPQMIMYAGVNALTSYEPPADETALLAYQRGVLPAMITECFNYYSGQ